MRQGKVDRCNAAQSNEVVESGKINNGETVVKAMLCNQVFDWLALPALPTLAD